MAGVLVLSVYAALALTQQTDSTLTVRHGDRLDVYDLAGSVTVRVWNRSAIRVVAAHSSDDRITLTRAGALLSVAASTARDASSAIRYEISIPAWLPITVQGSSVSVRAEGALQDVMVRSQSGDVVVRGTVGSAIVSTMLGSVSVADAKGTIRVSAGKKPIHITRVDGDVAVAGVENDIVFAGMTSRSVDARTVSGSIVYEGDIVAKGRYHLSSKRGNVTATIPGLASATISVATHVGRFVTDHPTLQRTPPKRQRFDVVLGRGEAQIALEAFDGTVTLRRAPHARV